jgi:GNAT superfamily N-acetyltransferase
LESFCCFDTDESVKKPIRFVLHSSVLDYSNTVQSFLEVREAENSLLLGLLQASLKSTTENEPFMVHGSSGGEVNYAAFFLERNLVITRGSPLDLDETIEKLVEKKIWIPGIVGPLDEVQYFASKWKEKLGCRVILGMDQQIYGLKQVRWPEKGAGRIRRVEMSDRDLFAQWMREFCQEAFRQERVPEALMNKMVEQKLTEKSIYFWEDGGNLVSMAALSRPTSHGITVNYVYTPLIFRKKGYATRLVAEVSAEGLKQGKDFCVLYTDLANPTSNAIYQKIGYQPVSRSIKYLFEYKEEV